MSLPAIRQGSPNSLWKWKNSKGGNISGGTNFFPRFLHSPGEEGLLGARECQSQSSKKGKISSDFWLFSSPEDSVLFPSWAGTVPHERTKRKRPFFLRETEIQIPYKSARIPECTTDRNQDFETWVLPCTRSMLCVFFILITKVLKILF